MTNPNNAVGTNGAFGGRTSVNAFNDGLAAYSRGILSGWECSPDSGLTVTLGGDGNTRDVAIAEDNAGNKTTINNISGTPVSVTVGNAPSSNSRIDAIVAYVDNPPTGSSTITDNYGACGLIVVAGTVASTPTAPTENAIRTAITADGASGTTAYYVVLANVSIPSGTTTLTSSNITTGGNASIGPQGTTLFSGNSQCPITLSDSAANYEQMVIEYRCNDQTHATVTVYDPNNKDVLLSTGFNDRTSGFFLKTQNVLISGTSIDQMTNTYAREIKVSGSSVTSSTINNIWITKVTGYRFRI